MGRLPKNTTGFKGVYFQKKAKKYGAQIAKGKQHFWLGLFETAEEAHAAYVAAAQKLHGEFARVA